MEIRYTKRSKNGFGRKNVRRINYALPTATVSATIDASIFKHIWIEIQVKAYFFSWGIIQSQCYLYCWDKDIYHIEKLSYSNILFIRVGLEFCWSFPGFCSIYSNLNLIAYIISVYFGIIFNELGDSLYASWHNVARIFEYTFHQ